MALLVFEQGEIPAGKPLRRLRGENAEHSVTVGATSAQSGAFANSTRIITLHAGEACHVAIGKDPTATTTSFPMAAGDKDDFAVNPGDKVAVIAA